MAKFKPYVRLEDLAPDPIDQLGVDELSATRSRCWLNPRGQIWQLGVGVPLLDEHIAKLFYLPKLISIVAGSPLRQMPELTDRGIEILCNKTQFRAVSLYNFSNITNRSLGFFARNNKIQWLDLYCPTIDDSGVELLAGTNHLFRLGLNCAAITKQSIPILGRLTNLRHLRLINCRISTTAIGELEKMLPACKIESHSPNGG